MAATVSESSSSSAAASSSSSSSSSPPVLTILPPVARRDVDRSVWAGVAPPGWDTTIPRQSTTSVEPLINPPVAIPDPYGWLRDDTRTDVDVITHLVLENNYTNSMTNHLHTSLFVPQLYHEMIQSIEETDYTTPRPYGDYVYYTRTYQGQSYTTHCRAPHPAVLTPEWSDNNNAVVLPNSVLVDQGTTTTTEQQQQQQQQQRSVRPVLVGEQVTLNVNQLAENRTYCSTGAVKISPSHQCLAYSVDYTGNEIYQLFIKRLSTSSGKEEDDREAEKIYHDPTFDISGSIVWGHDDTTLYFLKQDAAQRPYQVYRRTYDAIVTPASSSPNHNKVDYNSYTDEMLYEEQNDLFWLHIYKSLDGQYLFIETSSKETSEIYYIDLFLTTATTASDASSSSSSLTLPPVATLQCVARRRDKVMYEVEHRHGQWWIVSNVGCRPNLALFTAPALPDSQNNWQLAMVPRTAGITVTATEDNITEPLFDGNAYLPLDGVTCFENHVVASGRQGGLPAIWILGDINTIEQQQQQPSDDTTTTTTTTTITTVGRIERLTFPEAAHDCGLGRHYEFTTSSVVVEYDSLVTPPQSIEINLDDTTVRTVLKARNVPGYDKEQYGCERTMVPSRDGTTKIPVSILYRRDLMDQHVSDAQPLPLHLCGYGSYGACTEASFVASRLPLLKRGMIYVLAHVRGGGEMGRTWYEEPNGGKYLCKKNTFNDFCDIAEWLIHTRKLTSAEKLSCEGRSAGGLLIGASINQAPHLFRVAVLGVPFVDVVPTMTDASIPLTAVEWEEWGNPNEIKYHQYMMEYNPITNVKNNVVYPACLLTGGFHDPRVQYWEPAKFAAELRHSVSNKRPICLKIDMAAGHFSASDRYKYLKEKAFDYAFILDQLGLNN